MNKDNDKVVNSVVDSMKDSKLSEVTEQMVEDFMTTYNPCEAGQFVVLSTSDTEQSTSEDNTFITMNLGNVKLLDKSFIVLGAFNKESILELLGGTPIAIDTLLAQPTKDGSALNIIPVDKLPDKYQKEMADDDSQFNKDFDEFMKSEEVLNYGNTLLHADLNDLVASNPEYQGQFNKFMNKLASDSTK